MCVRVCVCEREWGERQTEADGQRDRESERMSNSNIN